MLYRYIISSEIFQVHEWRSEAVTREYYLIIALQIALFFFNYIINFTGVKMTELRPFANT